MKKIAICLLLCLGFIPGSASAQELLESQTESKSIVCFNPPSGWQMADSTKLPPRVKFMVVGKGPSFFPPSMNLSSEPYQGTLKQYLKVVRKMDESRGYAWMDLGTIRTKAGNASLSQVDMDSEWGPRRTMQAILVKNGNVYILNASALKAEFSLFYKDFFNSMRSLTVAKDPLDMIPSATERTALRAAIEKVKIEWQTRLRTAVATSPDHSLDLLKEELFQSPSFQGGPWGELNQFLVQKSGNMGKDWQSLMLQSIETELFES